MNDEEILQMVVDGELELDDELEDMVKDEEVTLEEAMELNS